MLNGFFLFLSFHYFSSIRLSFVFPTGNYAVLGLTIWKEALKFNLIYQFLIMKEAWQKILPSDPIEMIEFIDSIDLQSNAMEGTNICISG